MKKKYMALMLAITIVSAVAIAPASASMSVKNYYNPITKRYVAVENYDNNYVEIWNRYKPNFSHYSDKKLLTLGKKGIYNAQQIDICIKSCAFSLAGCAITFLAPGGEAACPFIIQDYCAAQCRNSLFNIGINYLR